MSNAGVDGRSQPTSRKRQITRCPLTESLRNTIAVGAVLIVLRCIVYSNLTEIDSHPKNDQQPIPCVIYMTDVAFTEKLQHSVERNLKDSACRVSFYNDSQIAASIDILNDLWADSEYFGTLGFKDAFMRVNPFAFKIDLWRYAMLWAHGGIFLDTEIVLMRPPEEIFDLGAGGLQIVQDREDISSCFYNAIMASEQHNVELAKVLAHVLNNVKVRSYGQEDSQTEPWLGITGPCAMSAALRRQRRRKFDCMRWLMPYFATCPYRVVGRLNEIKKGDNELILCKSSGGWGDETICAENIKSMNVGGSKDGTPGAHYGYFWAHKKVYNDTT